MASLPIEADVQHKIILFADIILSFEQAIFDMCWFVLLIYLPC